MKPVSFMQNSYAQPMLKVNTVASFYDISASWPLAGYRRRCLQCQSTIRAAIDSYCRQQQQQL